MATGAVRSSEENRAYLERVFHEAQADRVRRLGHDMDVTAAASAKSKQPPPANQYELYVSDRALSVVGGIGGSKHWYARPYEVPHWWASMVTLDGVNEFARQYDAFVTGVPDGVHPCANEAYVPARAPRRLYYFADRTLSDDELGALDDYYKGAQMHLFRLSPKDAIRCYPPQSTVHYPRRNFYQTEDSVPSVVSRYVEYRYLQQRYQPSQLLYARESGCVFACAPLPDPAPPIVLVMPENFVQTGRNSGYFELALREPTPSEPDPPTVIMRVHSRNHALTSAGPIRPTEDNVVSDLGGRGAELWSLFEALFARLNLVRAEYGVNRLCAYDDVFWLQMVVGDQSIDR